MKKVLVIISTILLITAIVIGVYIVMNNHSKATSSLINKKDLGALTHATKSNVSTTRLAKDITPPTNKWFSGIALQETPQTVFPTPLAFTPTNTGFSYGLPGIESSADAIFATHRRDVSFEIGSADHYFITRYDELSVDLTYYSKDNSSLLTITIASGVPYIFVKSLSSNASITPQQQFNNDGDIFVLNNDHAMYAMSGFNRKDTSYVLSSETASLYAGFNKNDITTLSEYALNRITGVEVSYARNENNYKTTFKATTTNGKDTLIGYLPHQQGGSEIASFATIYGKQRLIAGQEFSFSTPYIDTPDKLNINSISSDERQELITMLRREINATSYKAIDTYYSGKELYRSAQLLKLAQELDQPLIAGTIQQKLLGEFRIWFSPAGSRTSKYFYYDDTLKTIVGEQASFGSQDDNDHHFHYGYFIYAASILAQYDKSFVSEYGDMVDLLVADIANYNTGENLPLRRSFDPYFGHSWASGSSPFNDGNNQESSSEAINAWVGTSLWSQVTKNNNLQDEASWMLSQEVAAMQSYWLNNASPEANSAYTHQIYSLNWGGKRDYSTFFTAEPAAKLGILLIPLNPAMQSESVLLRDRIAPQLQESGDGSKADVYNFQDYLLMYKALQDSDNKVLDSVKSLDEADIDSANSRSYMYTWVISARQ